MAIDQAQLLQMLLQGGGGSPIQPTSGLQDPVSLSGLQLGPQGQGLGGGQTLLGGGLQGFGGGVGGGPSLDLAQLLAQLTGGGATNVPLGQPGGAGFGTGFGAGGQLAPQQGEGLQGSMQAGLGGGGFLSGLRDITEAIRLSRAISGLFPSGGPEGQAAGTASGGGTTSSPEILRGGTSPDLLSALRTLGLSGATPLGADAAGTASAGGAFAGTPGPTAPFQMDPRIFSGASGGGAGIVSGPETGAAATGTGAGTGATSNLGANLGTAGVLGGLGSSIAQDNPQGAFASALGGLALGLGNPLLAAPFAITSILDAIGGFETPESPERPWLKPALSTFANQLGPGWLTQGLQSGTGLPQEFLNALREIQQDLANRPRLDRFGNIGFTAPDYQEGLEMIQGLPSPGVPVGPRPYDPVASPTLADLLATGASPGASSFFSPWG